MAEKDYAYDNITADQLAEAREQIQHQLVEGSARMAQQRAQCQALLREAKLARATANDSSWELADVEQRLRELAEQREGPVDSLLEREIAHLTGRRAQLEERVLTQLLLIDELTVRTQAEEQALASAQRDWAAREIALLAERDRLSAAQRTEDT
jgi:hypothetical protein